MTSTVKAFLVAALLVGVTSAGLLKVAPGVDCWYKDRYCETTGVQPTTLTDDLVEDVEECYNLCAAEPTCNEFTVKTNGKRPGKCYMLTEACVENKVDDCIAFGKCVSGPSDCAASSGDSNCPPLPALAPEFVIWQCTDANLATFNPYTDESSPGTICKQVCPAWTTVTDGSLAQMSSTCKSDGTWSETETNGDLNYPPLAGGLTYPAPDALADTALTCGCETLPITWDPTPLDTENGDNFPYDPNAEDAAEFICTADIQKFEPDGITAIDGEFEINTGNTCVLYCDEHYVATASCVDGQWTGNPEFGFWCYAEPQA